MKPYFETPDGKVRIFHGDAREVLPRLTETFDLVLTDPPYQSLDLEVKVGTTTRLVRRDARVGARLASADGLSWFETIPNDGLIQIIASCRLLLVPTGAMYVFADVKTGLQLFPVLDPANVIVWDKGTLGMGFNWRRMHEWIAFCPMPDHRLRDATLGDILRFPGVHDKKHPTEKPTGLLRSIIRNSTDADATILDPFGGSGTTMRACMDLGRRGVMIELDERYCEIAARRLSQQVLPIEVAS